MLARSGESVTILERNDRIGGCIRSEDLFTGFTHDLLSSSYPLFVSSPAYELLGAELHEAGLEFANTTMPTAIVTDQGESLIMSTDPDETRLRFERAGAGDGDIFAKTIGEFFEQNAELTFGLLGNELLSRKAAGLLFKEIRKNKIGGTVEFFGDALETCRTWVERDFDSELVRGLIAPWVLHAGLGPDDAYSGLMGKVIMGAVGMFGMPVVVGGSGRFLEAFRRVIEGHGGEFHTDRDVARIITTSNKATGVETVGGDIFHARRGVIANVTPTQLYGRLLSDVPADVASRASAFRYGRADMQVHYALSQPPQWPDPELAKVAYVHVTSGLDGVSKGGQRG